MPLCYFEGVARRVQGTYFDSSRLPWKLREYLCSSPKSELGMHFAVENWLRSSSSSSSPADDDRRRPAKRTKSGPHKTFFKTFFHLDMLPQLSHSGASAVATFSLLCCPPPAPQMHTATSARLRGRTRVLRCDATRRDLLSEERIGRLWLDASFDLGANLTSSKLLFQTKANSRGSSPYPLLLRYLPLQDAARTECVQELFRLGDGDDDGEL